MYDVPLAQSDNFSDLRGHASVSTISFLYGASIAVNEPSDDDRYDWFHRKLWPYQPYMVGLERFIKATIATPNPIDGAQSDDYMFIKALFGLGVPNLSLEEKKKVLGKLARMRG